MWADEREGETVGGVSAWRLRLPSPDRYGIHSRDDETRYSDLRKVLALPLGSGMSSSSVTMTAVSAGVWSYGVTDYGGLQGGKPVTFSNKVNWTIEPERCALLIHDMQPHYLKALSSDKRDQIIRKARLIGAACARQGIPIFASQALPTRQVCERGLMMDMWGKGPSLGSQGLDPELGLEDHQIRLLAKRSYSAFYANDFELMLRRLGRSAVLITGVYTSIGCHYSAVDAFARDIRAFLIADAMADLCETDHDVGLSAAARTCARVVESVEVVEQVDPKYRRGRQESRSFDVC